MKVALWNVLEVTIYIVAVFRHNETSFPCSSHWKLRMAFGASASPMSGQHIDLNILAVHRKRTEEWVGYV